MGAVLYEIAGGQDQGYAFSICQEEAESCVLAREEPKEDSGSYAVGVAGVDTIFMQQMNLMRGMGKDGSNGGLVVLNTQDSSQDVLKALAENPRAVQAILGGQQRKGVR